MDKRLTAALAVAALAACLATTLPASAAYTIAQADSTPPAAAKDDASVFNPPRYPETADEIAECMKTWDRETGMSRAEYEAACRRTLKYYPESPNTPAAK
jgi:hypothetical protein